METPAAETEYPYEIDAKDIAGKNFTVVSRMVLVDKNSKVLYVLLENKKNPDGPPVLQLPGGKLDITPYTGKIEEPRQAALRELMEETNLVVKEGFQNNIYHVKNVYMVWGSGERDIFRHFYYWARHEDFKQRSSGRGEAIDISLLTKEEIISFPNERFRHGMRDADISLEAIKMRQKFDNSPGEAAGGKP